MELSRDFRLWLYRDRYKLTWADLDRQPGWRTDRDLAYLALEGLAAWWHAEQARAQATQQQQANHIVSFTERARAAMGR